MELIMPYFVTEGKNKAQPIKSMPGISRLSVDNLLKDIEETKSLGIKKVLLFGVVSKKDEYATSAYSKNGVVQQAIRLIKQNIKGMTVMADVCLCGYTTHSHCRIFVKGCHSEGASSTLDPVYGKRPKNLKERSFASLRMTKSVRFFAPEFTLSEANVGLRMTVDKKRTLEILAKIALSYADAGVDFTAPSAMMPGQVRVLRGALDKNGFKKTKILAYSAKFASNFYWPFREALNSAPRFGDRSSYQLSFTDSKAALERIKQDIDEGADIVMVKPALAYLDIIRLAKDRFSVPIAAYNTSGEYAMLKSLCWSLNDQHKMVLEILSAIKRAGADFIITYHAKESKKISCGRGK